jgi:hypothetical protein
LSDAARRWPPTGASAGGRQHDGLDQTLMRLTMFKYIIAWLLGVPALVLVIVYFFFR